MFGIASSLYELGGLIVMHDASGCNSTYDTHDEPRSYDTQSMVYISGLNEIDTIQGNDQRLIDDIAEAAEAAQPRFIAIGGSPMPNAIGTDFKAIQRLVADRTGLPTLGFAPTASTATCPEPAVPMSGWPSSLSNRPRKSRSFRPNGSTS